MKLNVFLNMYGKRDFIGVLDDNDRNIYFQYSSEFIKNNIELSPYKLPLSEEVYEDKNKTFDGLFGLFNDSLPDGWGCLLLDRSLQKQGPRLNEITQLNRLAMVGRTGMGALEYEPVIEGDIELGEQVNLDNLHTEANKILAGSSSDALEELLTLNGAYAGARPKVLVDVSEDKLSINRNDANSSPWIIKFSSALDSADIGAIEYIYSLMVKDAGIEMPETYLFPSNINIGHFGVKRFDRVDGKKIHIHSACGLLHASHRPASLDYSNLLKLTLSLTKDNREVEKMFRLMVFNILSGNKDDHSKNFSFMMNEEGDWKLTPAYDITPSQGINGEQTAMVNGKGKDIDDNDFAKLGADFEIPSPKIREIIGQVKHSLSNYPKLAKEYGIKASVLLIHK